MATLRIGIVAGEASGDILGAGLMAAIIARHPNVQFEGIGGPLMIAQGFNSHFAMDRLSVMGFVEPLKRLPELLRMRRHIKQHFINNPPDLFLGVDAPDFTLNIELALRARGILTAHYVSPSVWAWRQGRVKKIAKAVDHMLTLLPFEADFYRQHQVPVSFVGHPLADTISLDNAQLAEQQIAARAQLSLPAEKTLIALLPGSRAGEVNLLGQSFIDTARWCYQQRPDLHFVIPAANDQRLQQLQRQLKQFGQGLPITLIDGQSQQVMRACDMVLMASGTTALEALLLKKPMVVAYRLSTLTYWIAMWLVKSKFFSLPNLLADEALVPEVLQKQVRPEVLGPLILERLQGQGRERLIERFSDIHQQLKLNASQQAAGVLLEMVAQRNAA